MRVNFDQYWGFATARVACRECGRISVRKIQECCTVNPFNRNDDGSIRTPEQVQARAKLRAAERALKEESAGRICRPCSPKATGEPDQ